MTDMRTPDEPHPDAVRGLVDFASAVLWSADSLVSAGASIREFEPGEQAFGADGAGGFGELCRKLHGQWQSALQARAGEAANQGARLLGVAELLGKVAANYAETDVTLSHTVARAGDAASDTRNDAGHGVATPERTLTIQPDDPA